MKVLIRTDSSLRVGSGHVMRCLTLADRLQNEGAKVLFACRGFKGNLIAKIKKRGYEILVLEHFKDNSETTSVCSGLAHSDWLGVPQSQDFEELEKQLAGANFDLVIVDHYALDKKWEQAARHIAKKVFVIDDLGDREHCCDILLDQNYKTNNVKYDGLVPLKCERLFGLKYSLLRPSFNEMRALSLKKRELRYKKRALLISMGGIDEFNYTGKILSEFQRLNLKHEVSKLTILMGRGAPFLDDITEQVTTLNIETEVIVDAENVAELMSRADLAIGGVGSTTWERFCLGLPAIVFVMADNQRRIAEKLAEDKLILLAENISDLRVLLSESALLESEITSRCSELVDGLGAERVVNKLMLTCGRIESSTENVQLVLLQDLPWTQQKELLRARNHPEVRRWMYNKEVISEQSHRSFLQSLANNKAKIHIVAFDGDHLVGSFNFSLSEDCDHGVSLGIYANPNIMRKGLGSLLIVEAERFATKYLDKKDIYLEVLKDNSVAIAFYKKFDFEVIRDKSVNAIPVWVMKKSIGNSNNEKTNNQR